MSRSEVRWAVTRAWAVMLITCLPYLYVAAKAPPGTTFLGMLANADDHCVYLSWEQQAAHGHFLMRNLFTNTPQRNSYISLLAWLIGTVSRLTGLPLILVHHGARVVFGVLLLVLAYRLFALFTADTATRRVAFWCAALSSGGGWLLRSTVTTQKESVDLWVPEAITFSSLYAVGLFCAALCLMLGILLLLLAAEGKTGGERWLRVAGAGVLGLLLGNIHSYDVITVAGVWTAYLAARTLARRVEGRGSTVKGPDVSAPRPSTLDPRPFSPRRALVDALVAALIALPATLYQYYLYRTEPVFRMRADLPTPSPPLASYLMGYGLILLLAIGGAVYLVWTAQRTAEPLGQRILPLSWAVVGFALPYLPLAFQRKLVMGLHLPLSFLAAVGIMALARFAARAASGGGEASHPVTAVRAVAGRAPAQTRSLVTGSVVACLLLLMVPGNLQFLGQDLRLATVKCETRSYVPPYLIATDLEAMRWARAHLPEDGVLLSTLVSGALIPALAGRAVYVGHPSETPHLSQRREDALVFFTNDFATPDGRRRFMEARRIRYVYQGTIERRIERQSGAPDLEKDPYFRPVYRNGGVAIYELRTPGTQLTRMPD